MFVGGCVIGAGAAVTCPQAVRRKARRRIVEKRFFVFMLIPFAFHVHPAVNHRLFLQWMKIISFCDAKAWVLSGKVKSQVRKCTLGRNRSRLNRRGLSPHKNVNQFN
jgi:hypothetical protein